MIENPTCGAELRNYLMPMSNVVQVWKQYLSDPDNASYQLMLYDSLDHLSETFDSFKDLCDYLDRYEFNRDDFEKISSKK